jgi:hypothetical protein
MEGEGQSRFDVFFACVGGNVLTVFAPTLMRSALLPIVAAFSILSFAAFAGEPNTLTSEEKAAGWQLLFDGKTTDGWVAIGKTAFPEKGWSVVDGILDHAHEGGGGDIVTTKDYDSFELTWDWKIEEAGNSGVKYNLPNPAKNVGFEYQLLDDDKNEDGQRGGRLHQTGSLYDLIEPPADKKVMPVGEWNSSRLLVNGTHVEQWLNGEKTVEFEIGSPDLLERVAKSKYKKVTGFGLKIASPILLQDHGSAIAFRSIKIRVIDAK